MKPNVGEMTPVGSWLPMDCPCAGAAGSVFSVLLSAPRCIREGEEVPVVPHCHAELCSNNPCLAARPGPACKSNWGQGENSNTFFCYSPEQAPKPSPSNNFSVKELSPQFDFFLLVLADGCSPNLLQESLPTAHELQKGI